LTLRSSFSCAQPTEAGFQRIQKITVAFSRWMAARGSLDGGAIMLKEVVFRIGRSWRRFIIQA
jgi:hypothetical protein